MSIDRALRGRARFTAPRPAAALAPADLAAIEAWIANGAPHD
jgi:hypothetical protein